MKNKILRNAGKLLYCVAAKRMPVSYAKIMGTFSKKARLLCAKLIICECGKNVNIEKGAEFASNIKIGNNSGIGKNSIVGAFTEIGDNVMIGEAVFIYTRNHKTERTDIPMCMQGFENYKPVFISDDVWIGSRVTILPGSKIGRGAIIGAGAVVAGEVPDFAVACGVPARVVKYRK